ncbi:MAG TPA: GNAT family N-acetyltransferase [Euzebyales bacterium]|nr:GNAT family N-acetyltransferase [Euzebyales bacterium]
MSASRPLPALILHFFGRPVQRPSRCRRVDRIRLDVLLKRLDVRPLALDDLDNLASMLGDADGLVHWGPPRNREKSRSWIERNIRRYEEDRFGRCAVILRDTGEFVGDCGLIRTRVERQSEVELGWIVRRAHRGKGIATEAAASWRDYAFDTLGLERIVSMVSENNVASRRVAEKLGMTVEREATWGDLPHLMYFLQRDHRSR